MVRRLATQQGIMPSLGSKRVVELFGANLRLGEVGLVAVFETADEFTTSTLRLTCRWLLYIDLRPSLNSFVSSVNALLISSLIFLAV